VIDTLKLAKEQNPGKKASLNALCALYEIDNTHRTLHGALLDAELLADVYLAMTRGQESLIMSLDEPPRMDDGSGSGFVERPPLRVLRVSPEELEGHERVLGRSPRPTRGTACGFPGLRPGPDSRKGLENRVCQGQAARQARGLDPEQLHQAGKAVGLRAEQHEVGCRFVRAVDLRPDAGIGRHQRAVRQIRPVTPNGRVKGCGPRRGHAARCIHPFHVGSETGLAARSRVR
jgi:hypothetical protein